MGRVVSGHILGIESWDRQNRKKGAVRKGVRTVTSTFFVISVLIIFYLLFVSTRLWVVNLGYRTSQALKEQKELLEINEKLKIERAYLISPARIDSEVRQKLRMREPRENQIRFVP